MQNVALIGIDLGTHSFHIHCQDKQGNPLLRKKFGTVANIAALIHFAVIFTRGDNHERIQGPAF